MATAPEKAPASAEYVPWMLRRPGFWRSRRVIARMKRFHDLAIHYDRWTSHIDQAQPLEKLIGKTQNAPTDLEREMNKLVFLVARDMELAGVRHGVTVTDPIGKKLQFDLLADYTVFPDYFLQERFDILMARLEMAIGVYEERKHQAVWDWFNPLFWIASVVRIPVTILEFAGLVSTVEAHSAFLKFYAWVVRIVFVFGLVFLVAFLGKKAGVSFPWDLVGHLFK